MTGDCVQVFYSLLALPTFSGGKIHAVSCLHTYGEFERPEKTPFIRGKHTHATQTKFFAPKTENLEDKITCLCMSEDTTPSHEKEHNKTH